MEEEIHFEKDKHLIPYLLASQPEVSFITTKNENGVIYFGFTPAVTVLKLISDYFTDKCTPMSPKKLFESVEEFRTILYREKSKFSRR